MRAPHPVDVVVGCGLLALGTAEVLGGLDYDGGTARLWAGVALQTLPLAWLRVAPVGAVALSVVGLLVEVAGQTLSGGAYGFLVFVVIVHGIARWTSGAARRRALALLGAGTLMHFLALGDASPGGVLGNVAMTVLFGAVAWAAGSTGRRGADHEARLAEAREEAIAAERARISRDLHDIVGHALAGISLTAAAAGPDADGEVGSALARIRTLSHDASADVRRLVGMLREGDADATTPQPTLADVDALVAQARDGGAEVTHEVCGTPARVPAGLALAAYRVVQEGVTNAVRHSPGASVTVRTTWRPALLAVTVENGPATGRGADGTQGGYGLVGLRERVEVYGGTLSVGPTPDGGWLLGAELPR